MFSIDNQKGKRKGEKEERELKIKNLPPRRWYFKCIQIVLIGEAYHEDPVPLWAPDSAVAGIWILPVSALLQTVRLLSDNSRHGVEALNSSRTAHLGSKFGVSLWGSARRLCCRRGCGIPPVPTVCLMDAFSYSSLHVRQLIQHRTYATSCIPTSSLDLQGGVFSPVSLSQ